MTNKVQLCLRRVVNRLKNEWISFELSQSYHPLRARKTICVSSEARLYCEKLSIWPLLRRSISTGVSFNDYYFLHRYIISKKPKRVLEFGAGCTTLVMADALSQTGGHLHSYEDIPKYHDDVVRLIPESLKSHISLSLVEKVAVTFPGGLWGVRYATEIKEEVEMVFIDGPYETIEGRTGACLDVLFYLANHPNRVVDIIVDRKYGSLLAFQSVLPSNTVRYDPVMDLGFCGSCSGGMLRNKALRKPFRIRYGNVWDLIKQM